MTIEYDRIYAIVTMITGAFLIAASMITMATNLLLTGVFFTAGIFLSVASIIKLALPSAKTERDKIIDEIISVVNKNTVCLDDIAALELLQEIDKLRRSHEG